MVAAFHARAHRSLLIAAEGTRDAIRGRWEASFVQVDALRCSMFRDGVIEDIERLTREFLAGRGPLFDARVGAGRIVDGHGDIAFLAMDLERLGAPELGELLLDRYAEFAADPVPPALREHYLAYRAFVRVKVACLRHEQCDAAAAEEGRAGADSALRHLRRGQVRLVIVGGLPGTGKTTLADRLGAVLLSSDRLRKELAGISPADHVPAPYRAGIYTAAHTERTCTELLARAETLLAYGGSVVLDASWAAAAHRASARDVAERPRSGFVPLRCQAPVAEAMATDMDPWPEAVTVPTTGSAADAVTVALTASAG